MVETSLEEVRAKFIRTYAAVPAKLREEIIALVDDKPYNWNAAFIEVKGKTKAGDAILRHAEALGLVKDAELR
ncbi:MAG: hypothetical protein AABW54_04035 [Candidatus Micrarchaeota archaeon]